MLNIFRKLDLLKICSILFFLGLISLFIMVIIIQPSSINIRDIGDDDIGKTVTINATVMNKILRNGNLFLDLKQNESYIKSVIFENDIRSFQISEIYKGSYISATGKVDKYMGELEIVIKRIKVVY